MTLWNLRFGDFEWQTNPVELCLENKRTLSSYTTDKDTQAAEGVFDEVSKIKGNGEFVGQDCFLRFEALENLYKTKKYGLLTPPGMKPFYAWFTALSLEGDEKPSVLRYSFEFLRASQEKADKKVHTAKGKETLFDIAHTYSVDLMSLVKLNPNLRRADEIDEGEQVFLC